MRDNQGREIARTGTTMRAAFEAALVAARASGWGYPPVAAMIAEKLRDKRVGYRKVPVWTVSRRRKAA